MITFVTWVNNNQEYDRLQKSVTFPAEWIPVDQVATSLSEAYHIGQQQATGDVVCYIHQDIIIHDPHFESKLLAACHRPQCGWVGVIGSLRRSARCWWDEPRRLLRGRVVQSDKTGKQQTTVIDFGRYNGIASQMDGLILATPHKDWQWPAIEGIHFVDLLMCYQSAERDRVNYIADIDLEHCSWGETHSKGFARNHTLYLQHVNGIHRIETIT